MGRFNEIVEETAKALGWPASDLRNRGVVIRGSGLIPRGKSGRGAGPKMTSQHVTALLLGIMVSVPAARCANAVARCLKLERIGAREVTQILPDLVDADYGRAHAEAQIQNLMPGGLASLIHAFGEEQRLRDLQEELLDLVPWPCELASVSVTTLEHTFTASVRLRFHKPEEHPRNVEIYFVEPDERHAPTGADVGIGARTVTLPGVVFAILANLINGRPAAPLDWQRFGLDVVPWLNAA